MLSQSLIESIQKELIYRQEWIYRGQVGFIVNPTAGKDIQRLIAYGTVFDTTEKIGIVRRILLGLEAEGKLMYRVPEILADISSFFLRI